MYRDDETHRFQLGWTWCDCLGSIAVTTDPFSKQGLNGDFLVIFVGWFEGFLCDLLESETWDHFHHLELITGIGSFSFIFICHCGFPRLNEPGPFIYSTYIVDPGFGTSDEAISETWKNHFSRSKIDSSQEIWNIRGPKLHFNFHKIQQVWGFLRQDVERFASQKVLVDFKDGIKIAKSRTSSIICQGVSGSIIGSTWKVIFFPTILLPKPSNSWRSQFCLRSATKPTWQKLREPQTLGSLLLTFLGHP